MYGCHFNQHFSRTPLFWCAVSTISNFDLSAVNPSASNALGQTLQGLADLDDRFRSAPTLTGVLSATSIVVGPLTSRNQHAVYRANIILRRRSSNQTHCWGAIRTVVLALLHQATGSIRGDRFSPHLIHASFISLIKDEYARRARHTPNRLTALLRKTFVPRTLWFVYVGPRAHQ